MTEEFAKFLNSGHLAMCDFVCLHTVCVCVGVCACVKFA